MRASCNAARRSNRPSLVQEWLDFEFIVGEVGEIVRPTEELTGWETVRFEIADGEEEPETS